MRLRANQLASLVEANVWETQREVAEIERELNSIGDEWVDLYATLYEDNVVELHHIAAKKGAPAGAGTAAMEKLCAIADRLGMIICLTTGTRGDGNPSGPWKRTSSASRLIKFYRRFGFVKKSSIGRYDLSGNLCRIPKKST